MTTWESFANHLVADLPHFTPGDTVVFRNRHRTVQFRQYPTDVHATVVGNDYLPPADHITETQAGELAATCWQPPQPPHQPDFV